VKVRYLRRDRDAKFPALFDRIRNDTGIHIVPTGVRVPPDEFDHGTVAVDPPP
jgi:hypothetical protein